MKRILKIVLIVAAVFVLWLLYLAYGQMGHGAPHNSEPDPFALFHPA